MSEASPPEDGTTSNYRDPNASRDWLRQLMAADRLCEEQLAARRNLLKRMKAAGENTVAARKAIRLAKLSHENAIGDTRDLVYYMALRNIPVHQDDLFAFDTAVNERTRHEDDIWDIQEKGYNAGRLGVRIEENPYPAGQQSHVEWQSWWHKGQEALARILGPDTKPADPSRKRPRQTRLPGTEHRQRKPATERAETAALAAEVTPEPAPVKQMRRKAEARKKSARRKANGRKRAPGPQRAEDGVTVY